MLAGQQPTLQELTTFESQVPVTNPVAISPEILAEETRMKILEEIEYKKSLKRIADELGVEGGNPFDMIEPKSRPAEGETGRQKSADENKTEP